LLLTAVTSLGLSLIVAWQNGFKNLQHASIAGTVLLEKQYERIPADNNGDYAVGFVFISDEPFSVTLLFVSDEDRSGQISYESAYLFEGRQVLELEFVITNTEVGVSSKIPSGEPRLRQFRMNPASARFPAQTNSTGFGLGTRVLLIGDEGDAPRSRIEVEFATR
jgi:hypothetical protein